MGNEEAIDDAILQEQNYVHNVYNEIASHFSLTRFKPWPIVENFLRSQQDCSIGIDVGCGNGKYLGVNKKLFIIGTDRSEQLINCAQSISKNSYNLGVADVLSLPHPNNRFDFAISIAVVHHLSTEERRVAAIAAILKKLRVGGRLLVYCWALEQENSRRGYKEGDDQDVLVPWVLQNKKKSRNELNNGDAKELVKDFNSKTSVSDTKFRYYHLYRKGELGRDALNTKMCSLIDHGYEKDNWWVIVERT